MAALLLETFLVLTAENFEYIKYLKRENKSNFDEFKNYYIQRNLRRFIQIDKKILDKNNCIIVSSEEDFNLKCKEKNNNVAIHFLKLSSDNPNLIWHKLIYKLLALFLQKKIF